MPRSRSAFAAALVLALLCGPAVAACVNCCPPSDERATVISMPACCGNCTPSIESAPDQVPAAVQKATVDAPIAVLAQPIISFVPISSIRSMAPLVSPYDRYVPLAPAPLRL
jgi:hypothetical protein